MENANRFITYLRETADQLALDKLSLLDFDRLRDRLFALSDHLESQQTVAAERDILRRDYQQRLCGMLKAIAAADRRRQAPADTLDEIETLDTMSGEQLVEHYRRVAARFRDTFPNPNHRLRYVTTSVQPGLYK